MANQTSDRGESRYDADSGTHDQAHDSFFASAHHDHSGDDVFSVGHPMDAQNQPVQQVPIAAGTNVIRVQVTPGEVLELAPPFTPDANLAAREADGNLAIKVGDVTVILQGFIEANNTAPVVVETSDGKPIDIATVIAQTDPTIDIQTAAGPAAGAQGQGADNTGAILAQLAGGAGLGGLNAVGAQDGTSLSYGLIDNSIIQDRFLAAGPLGAGTGFSLTGSMSEPFLRDPIHVASGESYDDFITGYRASLTGGNGYADFNGTQSNAGSPIDPDAYLAQTTEHITIPSTGQAVTFNSMDFFAGLTAPMSNQHTVHVEVSDNGLTAYVVRDGDNAVIMVFHITSDGSTGPIHIDALLVDRVDHATPTDPDSVQDTLTIDFNTSVPNPDLGQGSDVPTIPGPGGHVDVLDDVPVVHDATYTSFYGDDNFAPGHDGGDTLGAKTTSHTSTPHETFTSNEFGSVDEDWLHGSKWEHNQGNKDQDNNPPGSNADPVHGDDLGRTIVTGTLGIDFGADGPSGAGGNDVLLKLDAEPSKDTTLALGLDNIPGQNENFLDANGKEMTSDGHTLVVLSHTVNAVTGMETLCVGYTTGESEASTESIFSTGGIDFNKDTVKVFELTLDINPNDTDKSGMDFQDFKFQLFHGIDQNPDTPSTPTAETNTLLHFDVVGHDDDGDAAHTGINIHVNDDVPTVGETCYVSFKGGTPDVTEAMALGFLTSGEGGYGGMIKSTDFGMVDEDWLKGGGANDTAGGPGNQDKDGDNLNNAQQNGDDYGKTLVFGALSVNFGGDGPTTQAGHSALSLATFAVGDTFVDADNHSFKTGGVPLIVLQSSEGHIEVGFKGEGGNDIPVFTLDVGTTVGAWNFGDFCFTLLGPIDHSPITGPDGAETSTLINFGVTATDADFDTAVAHINISVNDDKPEMGVTYYNEIPDGGSTGGSEGTFGLAVVAGYTGAGQVDEDWLDNSNSHGNQDHDAFGNPNPGQHGDKDGFTTVTGNLDVKYGGDGPGDVLPYTLGGTEGSVVQAKDDNGNTANLKTDDGHDVLLHIETVGGHEILTGYVNGDGSSGFVEGSSTEVFTLDLNTTGGDFTFTLLDSVSHPIAGTEDNLLLSFGVTAGTDGDGDVATGAINITINDDLPETSVDYTNKLNDGTDCPVPGATFGQVDEDWLPANAGHPAGNQDTDNPGGFPDDATRGDDWGQTIVTGKIGTTNFGADGPGNPATHPFALANLTVGANFLDADNKPVTQGHQPLVVQLSTDSDLIVGQQGLGAAFTLHMNADGTFTFTLLGPLDELPGASSEPLENNLMLQFLAANGATDGDGDPVTAYINIQVNDDAPMLKNDVDNGTHFQGGNVLSNDNLGADGGTVTGIAINGSTANVAQDGSETLIAGAFGTLHITDTGAWTYIANHPTAGGQDVFTYTVTDGDDDQANATLSITVRPDVIPDAVHGLASVTTGPTHTPGDYEVTMAVTHSTIELDSRTYHITDATGGHLISGGGGNDLIEVTGSQGSTLNGAGGDDIIHATAGHNIISGGNGDDTLFGGSGVDDFFGGKGHDAMSGGGGDDVFHNVDAADLDGTNTLDGIHSIDGGDGKDTVDLSGLTTFGNAEAGRIENVEVLDLKGGAGTTVTLSCDAVYGVTQVGGLHVLTISGDSADKVSLQGTAGTWTKDADTTIDGQTYSVFHAAATGGAIVTVNLDHHITDAHTNT